jgi:hypothetical protein
MRARKLKGLPYCPWHDRFECGLCAGKFVGSFEELIANYEIATVDFKSAVPIAIWFMTRTEMTRTWTRTYQIGWVRLQEGVWVAEKKALPRTFHD